MLLLNSAQRVAFWRAMSLFPGSLCRSSSSAKDARKVNAGKQGYCPSIKAWYNINNMKVLFLDVDGVINCETTMQRSRGYIGIDPYMAFLVGKIQLDTGCEVVLSSAWRHFEGGRDEVEQQVCKLLDVTPDCTTGFRGDEVRAWLKLHPEVIRYAILDDNDDFHDDQPLFLTSWKTGITKEIAENVTNYINGK